MTQCNAKRLTFPAHGRREVVVSSDGGAISSDGGVPLLREVDRRLELVQRLSQCSRDERSAVLVQHRLDELVAQRVYALAHGCEDLHDHEPLLGVVAGKHDVALHLLR